MRQRVTIIAEGVTGNVDHRDDLILFHGDGVHHACHLACWDGREPL